MKGLIIVEVISSEHNDKVKYLKKLYSSRNRKKMGKFILEGYRIIEEAVKAGAEFDKIYMTVDFYKSKQGKLIYKLTDTNSIYFLEKKLLVEMADTSNPQGIIAVVNDIDYRIDDLFHRTSSLLLLDRIQDPGNMGTIIRTAAAAGFDGIIILKGSVDIYNLKVLRATMGAIFNIPVIKNISLDLFNEYYQRHSQKYKLISTDLTGSKYYYHLDYNDPVILTIGNEANGISDSLLQLSDEIVKIPMSGEIESLNAGIAAGIIMYKVVERNKNN